MTMVVGKMKVTYLKNVLLWFKNSSFLFRKSCIYIYKEMNIYLAFCYFKFFEYNLKKTGKRELLIKKIT